DGAAGAASGTSSAVISMRPAPDVQCARRWPILAPSARRRRKQIAAGGLARSPQRRLVAQVMTGVQWAAIALEGARRRARPLSFPERRPDKTFKLATFAPPRC